MKSPPLLHFTLHASVLDLVAFVRLSLFKTKKAVSHMWMASVLDLVAFVRLSLFKTKKVVSHMWME
ncbi:hypothetical protein HanRHA438_Chr17g0825571 [Helianthus annuus]|nr:hypothetical protein HanHA300_Chr17g0663941 [Helianthus annuus]KAJ0448439.1 hypothetical protein HanHA89_Chr17g0716881 [Helianthus annuus]KAJ0633325.1 hypothetical protein HanLR1_Chr17g0675401 [Helianthus annuus]KAJ0827426.1 hypothetical protein HanRHA438_Chr17g0825571 [Helianthus annuus]